MPDVSGIWSELRSRSSPDCDDYWRVAADVIAALFHVEREIILGALRQAGEGLRDRGRAARGSYGNTAAVVAVRAVVILEECRLTDGLASDIRRSGKAPGRTVLLDAGASGNTIWNGTATPISATGVKGDFYLDTTTNCLYGP